MKADRVIALVATTLLYYAVIQASPLIALHQLIEVAVGGEVVLNLSAYNLGSDETTATITSLPKSGKLYQLSYNYNVQGHDPKAGVPILSVPFAVKGTKSRIVYKRPDIDSEVGEEWGRFTYYVANKEGKSYDGSIVLVSPSHVVVSSDFRFSDEGWTTIGNRPNFVKYEPSSRSFMNRFIYAVDNSINVNYDREDADVWYFSLPSKFLGWHGILYGGKLQFTMSSFGGDFNRLIRKNASKINFIEIRCSKCRINKGLTIGYPLKLIESYNGTSQIFSISLTESSGWLKDPDNENLPWKTISHCEFIQVLSGITSITILGDLTAWYESICLDDVKLLAAKPAGRRHLPSCAQTTPNARSCSCS